MRYSIKLREASYLLNLNYLVPEHPVTLLVISCQNLVLLDRQESIFAHF